VALDVCDAQVVHEVFQAARPTVIIHCAAYGVNYADQDTASALAVNVQGSLKVLAAAAACGVRRFVHVGSCFEYGSYPEPVDEQAFLNPTAIYGASKAAATILMRERATAFGVPLLVARPFAMWGPGEAVHRLIPQVITSCARGTPLKLTRCEVVRDYTYVEDMAARILALAFAADVPIGTIVNVGSGRGIVLRDFVLEIARLFGGERLMQFGALEYRPTEMPSLIANVSRLREFIGEQSTTSLTQGVQRTSADLLRFSQQR
jgi:nucleoside-diphosphate-sugar epimerase